MRKLKSRMAMCLIDIPNMITFATLMLILQLNLIKHITICQIHLPTPFVINSGILFLWHTYNPPVFVIVAKNQKKIKSKYQQNAFRQTREAKNMSIIR